MNDLNSLIKNLNIPPEKIQELAQTAQQNPFAVMGMIQQLGISPEMLQQLMAAVMSNPAMLFDLARQFGVNEQVLDSVKQKLPGFGAADADNPSPS